MNDINFIKTLNAIILFSIFLASCTKINANTKRSHLFTIKTIERKNMPNFDGTGPNGNGPLSGRGFGRCRPKKFDGTGPNGHGPRTGRGLGPCNGFRLYRRFWNSQENTNYKTEEEMLKQQKEILQEEINEIQQRLDRLKD
ncbi:hypothetical protein GF322_01380 [Candidatus Dependentiae bacterium]|nr:hypothetical protein [Candidatus Dependentiae bacterium]